MATERGGGVWVPPHKIARLRDVINERLAVYDRYKTLEQTTPLREIVLVARALVRGMAEAAADLGVIDDDEKEMYLAAVNPGGWPDSLE